jgi:hypothetical protein
MRILHFTGEGRNFMAGVEEYVVITDDDDTPIEDHCAPGFELSSETEVGELPDSLPLEMTLIVQR